MGMSKKGWGCSDPISVSFPLSPPPPADADARNTMVILSSSTSFQSRTHRCEQSVTLHTSLGELKIEVFSEAVPKAAEVGPFAGEPPLLCDPHVFQPFTPPAL